MKKKYKLGNWMRCFFEGEFESLEEAWRILSHKQYENWNVLFRAYMYVYEVNDYGIWDWVRCIGVVFLSGFLAVLIYRLALLFAYLTLIGDCF